MVGREETKEVATVAAVEDKKNSCFFSTILKWKSAVVCEDMVSFRYHIETLKASIENGLVEPNLFGGWDSDFRKTFQNPENGRDIVEEFLVWIMEKMFFGVEGKVDAEALTFLLESEVVIRLPENMVHVLIGCKHRDAARPLRYVLERLYCCHDINKVDSFSDIGLVCERGQWMRIAAWNGEEETTAPDGGDDLFCGKTAWHCAASMPLLGHTPLTLCIFKHVVASPSDHEKKDTTTLHKFKTVEEEILDILLGHPDIDVNRRNALGMTPLCMALQEGNWDIAGRLIGKGADLWTESNLYGGVRVYPIEFALTHTENCTDLVLEMMDQMIWRLQQDQQKHKKDVAKFPFFVHDLVLRKNDDVLRRLLANEGAHKDMFVQWMNLMGCTLDVRDSSFERTVLHHLVVTLVGEAKKMESMVEMFLDSGLMNMDTVCGVDVEGDSVLHLLAKQIVKSSSSFGFHGMVEMKALDTIMNFVAVDKGRQETFVNLKNRKGETCLHILADISKLGHFWASVSNIARNEDDLLALIENDFQNMETMAVEDFLYGYDYYENLKNHRKMLNVRVEVNKKKKAKLDLYMNFVRKLVETYDADVNAVVNLDQNVHVGSVYTGAITELSLNPNFNKSVLMIAVEKRNVAMYRYLLNQHGPRLCLNHVHHDNGSILHSILRNGPSYWIHRPSNFVVDGIEFSQSPNRPDFMDSRLFLLDAVMAVWNIFSKIRYRGPDLNDLIDIQDASGQSVLHLVLRQSNAMFQSYFMAQYLLNNYGPRVDEEDEGGNLPIMIALKTGIFLERTKEDHNHNGLLLLAQLIQKTAATCSTPDISMHDVRSGATLFHLLARHLDEGDCIFAMKVFLDSRSSPADRLTILNGRDAAGKIPLYTACLHNHRRLCLHMLKWGASWDAVDQDGEFFLDSMDDVDLRRFLERKFVFADKMRIFTRCPSVQKLSRELMRFIFIKMF